MKLLKSPGSGPEETLSTAQLLRNTNPKSPMEKTVGMRANSFPKDLPLNDVERRLLLLSMKSTCLTGISPKKGEKQATKHPIQQRLTNKPLVSAGRKSLSIKETNQHGLIIPARQVRCENVTILPHP